MTDFYLSFFASIRVFKALPAYTASENESAQNAIHFLLNCRVSFNKSIFSEESMCMLDLFWSVRPKIKNVQLKHLETIKQQLIK